MIAAGHDVVNFRNQLAKRLRFWLFSMPVGTGWATLRSCLKLCIGVSPEQSGVFSAGNGPAMRSPLLGVCVEDLGLLRQLVRASTRITHTDPKAEYGAFTVAMAARLACRVSLVTGDDIVDQLASQLPGDPGAEELVAILRQATASTNRGESTQDFAVSLGLDKGVSGYIYHTVPMVIHAWLSHQEDYRDAVISVVRCGGDADSTAALVGGIVGSHVGKPGIPAEWLNGLWEWPRTVPWMQGLAEQLHQIVVAGQRGTPPSLPIYGVIPRNAGFATVVLTHGIRRLLPPY